MQKQHRPIGFWIIFVFLIAATALILIGQTVALFDYDMTVRLGLQESPEEVGDYGVQVARGYAIADTLIYIPLMIASMIGLWLKKRWALVATAAVVGISVYWSVTCLFMFLLLKQLPDYAYHPGIEIWTYLAAFIVFGLWGLWYLFARGESLLE